MQNSLWEFAEFVVLFDHSICMGGKNRDWLLKTALFLRAPVRILDILLAVTVSEFGELI